MREYKRLTKYSEENQDYITPFCDTANCNGVCVDCDYEQVIINRLAEFENKIENGTLMEINKPFIKKTKCGIYLICKATVVWVEEYDTKAEAEKKLKELQNER